MERKKRVFTRKPYNDTLYTWSPDMGINKNMTKNKAPYFCSATPNSQGEDWISGYAYNVIIVNGQQKRMAYVACDYVQ